MLTKPCGRRGCDQIIRASSPSGLAKRVYCGNPCKLIAHRAMRFSFLAPTVDAARRGSITGARISAEVRHRAAVLAKLADLEQLITPRDAVLTLAPEQLVRVKALLVQAIRFGERKGYAAALYRMGKAGA